MKANRKESSPALAKGQLWSTAKGHIKIVELGKMLVHYKMLKDLNQLRRTQISRIDIMEGFLKTNLAQLVSTSASTAQPRLRSSQSHLNQFAITGSVAAHRHAT